MDHQKHTNNAPTIDDLYQAVKTLRPDRNVLQRLITAYGAGCKVDLHSVLKYESMPVPVVLAEINGSLRMGKKSVLADLITSGINCPSEIEL